MDILAGGLLFWWRGYATSSPPESTTATGNARVPFTTPVNIEDTVQLPAVLPPAGWDVIDRPEGHLDASAYRAALEALGFSMPAPTPQQRHRFRSGFEGQGGRA